MTRSEIESALARALEGDSFPGVVAAYLFGSFAEDRNHQESDVDVGVLLDRALYPDERQRFEQGLLLSSAFSSTVGGRTADVVILNDAPETFARHIVTRGRRFFCADPELDHCFVRDVQLRAPDLELFLDRMRRIKLEALGRDDLPRRTTG